MAYQKYRTGEKYLVTNGVLKIGETYDANGETWYDVHFYRNERFSSSVTRCPEAGVLWFINGERILPPMGFHTYESVRDRQGKLREDWRVLLESEAV